MPFSYSPEQRDKAIEAVIKGLSEGTPLTVICRRDGMPCDNTVRDWADSDPQLAADIARARDAGFDQIALDALAIADAAENDTKTGADGRRVADAEWISRSKLRVETRLKLLAKWDPKRYGDRTLIGSDPDNPLPSGFDVSLVKSRGPQEG